MLRKLGFWSVIVFVVLLAVGSWFKTEVPHITCKDLYYNTLVELGIITGAERR